MLGKVPIVCEHASINVIQVFLSCFIRRMSSKRLRIVMVWTVSTFYNEFAIEIQGGIIVVSFVGRFFAILAIDIL